MTTLGWITGFTGLIAITAVLVFMLAYFADLFIQRIQARGESKQFHLDMDRLRRHSWWFSEDPATAAILMDIANEVDIERVRENWRKARQAGGKE